MTPALKLTGALLAVAALAAVAGAAVMNARLGGLGYFVVGIPVGIAAGCLGIVGWWLLWRSSTGSGRVTLVLGVLLWGFAVLVLAMLAAAGFASRPYAP